MIKKIAFLVALFIIVTGIGYMTFRPKPKPVAPYTQITGAPELPVVEVVQDGAAVPRTSVTKAPAAVSSTPSTTAVITPIYATPTRAPGTQKITYPDASLGTKKSAMIASKWEMSPSITAKVNQLVHLEIKSTDADYGFALKDLNVNASLTPGKTLVLELVSDRTGTFTFECTSNCDGHGGLNATLVIQK